MPNKLSLGPTSLGIIIMMFAMFIMTLMDAAVKWLVNDYSIQQINFIRSIVAMLILAPQVYIDGGIKAFRSKRPKVHIWRSFLMVMISYTWFFALGRMELAEIGALVMVSPLFITALSPVLLKEKVGRQRWFAVIFGFLGMLIIIRPGSDVFQTISILPATVALGYALLILSNRSNRITESLTSLTYYPLIAIFIFSGFLLPFGWINPPLFDLLIMICIGCFGGIGHLCLTLAFRYASPPVLAPLEYTGLIWAILLGYFIFSEIPDLWTISGMIFIVTAGIFIIYREAVLKEN